AQVLVGQCEGQPAALQILKQRRADQRHEIFGRTAQLIQGSRHDQIRASVPGSQLEKRRIVQAQDIEAEELRVDVDGNLIRKDVARLADYRAQNRVVVDSESSANESLVVGKRAPGKARVRAEVVSVRFVDSFPAGENLLISGSGRVEGGG